MKLHHCSDAYLAMALDSFDLCGSDVVWLVADQLNCFAEYTDFFKKRHGIGHKYSKQQIVTERCKRSFKAEHDLTDDEFNKDHWQTLFAIQYPHDK